MASEVPADRSVVLVREMIRELEPAQQALLYNWAVRMMAVRASKRSRVAKAVAAVRLSARATVLKPVFLELRRRLLELGIRSKRLLWDDRNWAARLGLAGMAGAAALTGGQWAGIAALGGAIGVPLWMLTGAGGTVLGAIIDELEGMISDPSVPADAIPVDWVEVDRILEGSDDDEPRLLAEPDDDEA